MRRRPAIAAVLFLCALAGAGAWVLLRDTGAGAPGADADPAVRDAAGEGPAPAGLAPPETAAGPGLHVGAQEDTRTGAVALRVVNGDTKLPIAGVRVSVAGESEAGRKVRRDATTDESGAARVEGVPAGEAYLVRVSPPEGRTLERRDVVVREAATTDLGTFYTGAHGTIEGVVVDEAGKPVAKATVAGSMEPAALAQSDGDAFPSRPFGAAIASTESDENGAFKLEEVPVGMVAVLAAKTGYRSALDRAIVEPGGKPKAMRILLTRGTALEGRVEERDGRPVAHALVEVGTWERGGFDAREKTETDENGAFEIAGFGGPRFSPAVRVTPTGRPPTLLPRPPPIERFLRIVLAGGASLAVTVADDGTNDPVAEAVVTAIPPWSYDDVRDTAGRHETAATTGPRGVATLPVSPGAIPSLVVSAKGYLTGSLTDSRGAEFLRVAGERGALAEGETRALQLWIRRGPLVAGTVRDAGGAVVPRARVWLDYGNERGRTVETDGAGEYRISDAVVSRRPAVVARSPDGGRGAREAFPEGTKPTDLVVRIDVKLEDDPAGLLTGGRPGRRPSPDDQWASVHGRTVDPARMPLSGVRVIGIPERPAVTDEAGAYFLRNVLIIRPPPPFTPYVYLTYEEDGYLPASLKAGATEGQTVEAPDVVMGFGAWIRGVIRGPKGFAAAGASVFLGGTDEGRHRSTIVAADDTFELRALAAGEYTVHARGPGWVVRPVRATAGTGPDRLELRIVPLLEWEGRVVDEAGKPVEGAIVAFDGRMDGGAVGDTLADRVNCWTGADGRFRLATSSVPELRVRVGGRGVDVLRTTLPPAGTPVTLVAHRR